MLNNYATKHNQPFETQTDQSNQSNQSNAVVQLINELLCDGENDINIPRNKIIN